MRSLQLLMLNVESGEGGGGRDGTHCSHRSYDGICHEWRKYFVHVLLVKLKEKC